MGCDAVYQGTQLAFGTILNPAYDLRKANLVLSRDDFLFWGPGSLRYASEPMDRRRERTSAAEVHCDSSFGVMEC